MKNQKKKPPNSSYLIPKFSETQTTVPISFKIGLFGKDFPSVDQTQRFKYVFPTKCDFWAREINSESKSIARSHLRICLSNADLNLVAISSIKYISLL